MKHKLLDDMGGMEEIYTYEELVYRYRASRTIPRSNHYWFMTWLKGVAVYSIPADRSYGISYYGVPAFKHNYEGTIRRIMP